MPERAGPVTTIGASITSSATDGSRRRSLAEEEAGAQPAHELLAGHEPADHVEVAAVDGGGEGPQPPLPVAVAEVARVGDAGRGPGGVDHGAGLERHQGRERRPPPAPMAFIAPHPVRPPVPVPHRCHAHGRESTTVTAVTPHRAVRRDARAPRSVPLDPHGRVGRGRRPPDPSEEEPCRHCSSPSGNTSPSSARSTRPSPARARCVVRVVAAGACHSDLHLFHDFPPGLLPYDLPFTLGHENAGVVEALGDGVARARGRPARRRVRPVGLRAVPGLRAGRGELLRAPGRDRRVRGRARARRRHGAAHGRPRRPATSSRSATSTRSRRRRSPTRA